MHNRDTINENADIERRSCLESERKYPRYALESAKACKSATDPKAA